MLLSIRGCVVKGAGVFAVGLALFAPAAGHAVVDIDKSTAIFNQVYEQNGWESVGTRSGPGSTLASTHALRPALQRLLHEYDVHSLVDIPSGDFFWQKEMDWSGVEYIGMDIVPAMVSENQRRYGTRDGHIRFEVAHLSTTLLPAVDLIMVRDVLIHQPLELIAQSLRNLAASGARWALISTYPQVSHNSEIAEGSWRPINLQTAPFNLPEPELLLNEQCPEANGNFADKSMGLWRITQLQALFALNLPEEERP